MDFQAFVDCCASPCAVISVEITSDSSRGEMKVVCGNEAYRMFSGPSFHDGISCDDLEFGGPNFNDLCVRSAVMGQRVHSYAYNDSKDSWFDLTFFPLMRVSTHEGHCLLFVEASDMPDPERMASVSMDTAAAALRVSVALMSGEDLNAGVKQVLDEILERSGGFSARLTLVDHERREAKVLSEAFVKGFFADESLVEVVTPYEDVESWQNMLGDGNLVVIEREEDFSKLEPYNPKWVGTLRMFGVTSFIMTALRQGKTTIGYLQLSNFDVSRIGEVAELVELVTYLLSAQVANHLLVQELERLSTRDELTNLQNRHAMLQRIEAIYASDDLVPFGVVSIDLNGLKAMNDAQGHDAGDNLLLQATELLKGVFHEENLYRTGGDEFIVIATGIDRDDFEGKVSRLRRATEESDAVSFAIGAHWSDGSEDFKAAYKQSDELMYADKNAYYEAHTNLTRR